MLEEAILLKLAYTQVGLIPFRVVFFLPACKHTWTSDTHLDRKCGWGLEGGMCPAPSFLYSFIRSSLEGNEIFVLAVLYLI